MAVCPKCGSHNFHYELRSAGTRSKSNYYRTGSKNSWLFPAGQKQYRSQRNQKAVGICRDCGYIEEKQEKGCLFYLICFVFLFPVFISVWYYQTDLFQLKKKWRALIIAVFWLAFIAIVGNIDGNLQDGTSDTSASIWNVSYTELTDFDYYIDDHSIILKSYNGRHHSKVNIAPAYDIDGEMMPVIELSGTFALKSIDSVIVPEGVVRIADNTFNGCGVKNLYLPASLVEFYGWSYFHDVQKIYYGGTEEQWDELFTGDRARLDVIQIVCDTNLDALLTK